MWVRGPALLLLEGAAGAGRPRLHARCAAPGSSAASAAVRVQACARRQPDGGVHADNFMDVRRHIFGTSELSGVEASLLTALAFGAPIVTLFTLVTLVAATLLDAYSAYNRARMLRNFERAPPSLAQAVQVRPPPPRHACKPAQPRCRRRVHAWQALLWLSPALVILLRRPVVCQLQPRTQLIA